MTRTPFASAARAAELPLTTDPTPTRPTLIVAGSAPIECASLDDLAKRLHQLRGDWPGLEVATIRGQVSYPDLGSFPAWNVYRLDAAGGQEWVAVAAIQDRGRDALEAAITRTAAP